MPAGLGVQACQVNDYMRNHVDSTEIEDSEKAQAGVLDRCAVSRIAEGLHNLRLFTLPWCMQGLLPWTAVPGGCGCGSESEALSTAREGDRIEGRACKVESRVPPRPKRLG